MTSLETNIPDREGLVLPPIRVGAEDLQRLAALAESTMALYPRVADFLAREMDRATVAGDDDLRGAIRMRSEVTYRDDETGAIRKVVLVYPHEANIELNRISILTPVGAALIGLSAGQQIEFETPGGQKKGLTVLEVSE